jgi:hypothetical protein
MLLWVVGFYVLFLVWMLGNYSPREYRWIGMAAFLLFNAGTVWAAVKKKSTVPGKGMMREEKNG